MTVVMIFSDKILLPCRQITSCSKRSICWGLKPV